VIILDQRPNRLRGLRRKQAKFTAGTVAGSDTMQGAARQREPVMPWSHIQAGNSKKQDAITGKQKGEPDCPAPTFKIRCQCVIQGLHATDDGETKSASRRNQPGPNRQASSTQAQVSAQRRNLHQTGRHLGPHRLT
jgi:hypothetical protein